MELIKLEIENYKSVNEPISISFRSDLPTVLIGKNGSGKSNILEAIERIVASNTNLPGKYNAGKLRYKAHIRLEKEEFSKLFPNQIYQDESAVFLAYSCTQDGLHIDTIESDTIVPLLKKELDNIVELTKELECAVNDYEKTLEKIMCDDREPLSLRCYDIFDIKGNTTNYAVIKNQTSFFIDQVKMLVQGLMFGFDCTKCFVFSLPRNYAINEWYSPHFALFPFKLKYKKPELAAFEEGLITINESAIEHKIAEINKKTQDACERVDDILNKLKKQSERLLDPKETGAVFSFVRNVMGIFGINCGYILNENSQVLFKDLRKENEHRYYEPSRVIFDAYARKNKPELLNDKEVKISQEELEDFEKWLNENRPKFEERMYHKITASVNQNNQIDIFVHENNGEKVSIDETSSGRRWYFTYYFVKNTLGKGDTLIIDEPASMLHPVAQKEILNDILNSAKDGIRVIYSTHSPYLIPDEWKGVAFVAMGENGTSLHQMDLSTEDLKGFYSESFLGIFWYQEIYDYYKKSDFKSNITKEICSRLIKDHPNNSDIAKKLGISERTFYYWSKGEKNIGFENIIKAAAILKVDALTLIKEGEG